MTILYFSHLHIYELYSLSRRTHDLSNMEVANVNECIQDSGES